jgi:hypothetical protein
VRFNTGSLFSSTVAIMLNIREDPLTQPAPTTQSAPGSGRPSEALAGLAERVTFHNAESGFCVLHEPAAHISHTRSKATKPTSPPTCIRTPSSD